MNSSSTSSASTSGRHPSATARRPSIAGCPRCRARGRRRARRARSPSTSPAPGRSPRVRSRAPAARERPTGRNRAVSSVDTANCPTAPADRHRHAR
jgi:hypothetical protein